ncbi:MAG: glycosyltransferase family 4 protein, partial [Proteobacteria bacterium]|nr:glycosyltransferase family 4 protein [Pseudomonadota bacterium]
MKIVVNYTSPEGGQGSEIFGIDVAITHFLKAFFRHSRQEKFFFLPGNEESIGALKDMAQAEGVDFARCAWINPIAPRETLSDFDLFFRPDPNLADHIWRRLQLDGVGYALSTIVHTMSGERIADVLGQYLLAPTQTGDAVICPSNAIKDTVKRLWEIQNSYYQARFGGKFTCPVDLPVIPLGIHTDRFLRVTTAEHRAAQRKALNIAEDEIVILYVGRMSYATKAHPLPLFQAAESAAQRTQKKLRLVLYGFFKPELMEEDFKKMAADYCKTVKVDFVLNTDPRFPDGLWACGDIFASLIDNIQESFGFTPIEAMASGLPAVISDWDGYRDGVRHGTDGFLVPTCSVPPGAGLNVAAHYYNQRNYGDYLIRNNQAVAVDAETAAAAFVLLAEDAPRRARMGQSGRQRAITHYDWRVVIKAYEDLWGEQAKKRRGQVARAAPAQWAAVHPAYPDPSSMFGGFPSTHLSAQDHF